MFCWRNEYIAGTLGNFTKRRKSQMACHEKQEFICPNKVGLIEIGCSIKTIELGSNEIVGFDTLTGDKILVRRWNSGLNIIFCVLLPSISNDRRKVDSDISGSWSSFENMQFNHFQKKNAHATWNQQTTGKIKQAAESPRWGNST